jgi:multidrug efflux pump subunit AcrA (membrane-fusion protein)
MPRPASTTPGPALRRAAPPPILRRVLRAAVVLAAVLAAGSQAARCASHAGPTDRVATATVAREPFQRRITADGTLRAVQATEIDVPETPEVLVIRKLAWLAPDGSAVKAGDVVARFDPSDAHKRLRTARAELDAADARLRQEQLRATAAIADREAAATRAHEDADQARRSQASDPMIYSRNEIAAAEIDGRVAAARQLQAETAAASERRVVQGNVQLRELARRQSQLALAHATAALASMEIRAPGDGILVVRRDDHGELPRLGVELAAGTPVADLPAPGRMEAELFVLEVDGAGLEVGQPVDVAVTSRPELAFHGKIRLVDKLAKPRQAWVAVSYLGVVVELDRTDPAIMKPGQRVRGALVLDRQDALVVPRQAVFERAGASIVYRRGAHELTAVAVELGAATAGRVVVTRGLAAGDVIALRDPTRSADPAGATPDGSAASRSPQETP